MAHQETIGQAVLAAALEATSFVAAAPVAGVLLDSLLVPLEGRAGQLHFGQVAALEVPVLTMGAIEQILEAFTAAVVAVAVTCTDLLASARKA